MRLKSLIYLVIILLTFSCTDEPTLNDYNVSIKNNSSQAVNVFTYSNNDLISNISLASSESGLNCTYTDESFRGLFSNKCGIDSLVIMFSNDKGYIVNDEGSGNLNFSDSRNPFLPNGGFEINNNDYKFLITQEDFDNAFDLSE